MGFGNMGLVPKVGSRISGRCPNATVLSIEYERFKIVWGKSQEGRDYAQNIKNPGSDASPHPSLLSADAGPTWSALCQPLLAHAAAHATRVS